MKSENLRGIVIAAAIASLMFTVGAITILQSYSPLPSEGALIIENAFPSLSFTLPVDLQNANDGSNRLFVVEKAGVIRVFNNSPSTASSLVFLDITGLVSSGSSEMGLLGLAFHPVFSENGYFFVDYTADNPRRTVIARYEVNPFDFNHANSSSAIIILEVNQPYPNHNGGQISFGPDGYLYIALGDGGSAGDPMGNGQNRSTLLGSLLRIDVDNPDSGRNYSIPPDNPFVNNTMAYADEIFAYGLRNPWRFSFDTENGNLWLADVGQNQIEEIDLIQNGGNYGWNLKEGSQCYATNECEGLGLIDPLWEYSHDVGRSVTGGFVYRGSRIPMLSGVYLYGDFISGRIWYLEYDGLSITNNVALFDTSLSISSFGKDENNELYVLSYDGTIHTISTQDSTTPTTETTQGPSLTTSYSSSTTTSMSLMTGTTTEQGDGGMVDFFPLQASMVAGFILVLVLFIQRRR